MTFANGKLDYWVARTTFGFQVIERATGKIVPIPAGVTKIFFADSAVLLDPGGVEGQAYRLYQAAFDRKPDMAGLGFQIDAVRQVGLDPIAGNFLASPEFQSRYGQVDNARFVTLLYANVLHRTPDPGGLAYHLNDLAQGVTRAQILANFSESPENQANVAADIRAGVTYFPHGFTGFTGADDPVHVQIPTLHATSYLNAKGTGLLPFRLPEEAVWAAAYARADFRGDGKFTLFAAWPTYDNTKPIAVATPGTMAFYAQNDDGSYTKVQGMLESSVACMHPRKAAVADFNNDGKPDILLSCTGYDAIPFPGEKLMIVESTAAGTYRPRTLPNTGGYFHGSAAADLDGDGLIDFVATDGTNGQRILRVFRNVGQGVFQEVANAIPPGAPGFGWYTVELLDVDGDGKVDVLVGGAEYWGAPTWVIYGNGTTNLSSARVRVLPQAPGVGLVLDFVKIGSTLYVGRTNDDESGNYAKLGMQAIDLDSWTNISVTSRPSLLFYWIIPGSTGPLSDRIDRPL